jgi:glycosyltransferase involved in cell wall biosynthesis
MRILLLNDDFPPLGHSSVATIAANLKGAFEDLGHEVGVITTHRIEKSEKITREGAITSLPSSYRPSLRHYHCLYSHAMSAMLREEIARFRPDIVHAHNIHWHLTYDALRIAHRATPKVFLTLHDVSSFAFARLATDRFLASKGEDARLTLHDHLSAAHLEYNPIRNTWIRRILKTHVKNVVAVSDSLRHALTQNGINHAMVIPNGIDLAQWSDNTDRRDSFREYLRIGERPTILFGGRISFDKGIAPLTQALRSIRTTVPDVLLLVIGEKQRWANAVHEAHAEDLSSHFLCTGWLSRTEMGAAYAAADVVTTPSLCLDCFPSMNLEAMAAGKPVVGTIFGGTKEIVEQDVTGFVCDPRDTTVYAHSLLSLLRDPALRRRMGEAARRRVEQHFSLEQQATSYLQLFAASDTQ